MAIGTAMARIIARQRCRAQGPGSGCTRRAAPAPRREQPGSRCTAASTIAPPASAARRGARPSAPTPISAPGSARATRAARARWRTGARRRGGEEAAGAELHAAHERQHREIACRGGERPEQQEGGHDRPQRRRSSPCGSMSTVAWNLRSSVSCAAKQTDTPSASRLPGELAGVECRRTSRRCPRMRWRWRARCAAARARAGRSGRAIAARNGDTLISTKVLATVVRVSEPMKKKNVPARSAPATRPGQPTARRRAACARPCMTASTPRRTAP